MNTAEIRDTARQLKMHRAHADVSETKLRHGIDEHCAETHGRASNVAEKLSLKPQYLSDIRKGRRALSDAVVEKMARLK